MEIDKKEIEQTKKRLMKLEEYEALRYIKYLEDKLIKMTQLISRKIEVGDKVKVKYGSYQLVTDSQTGEKDWEDLKPHLTELEGEIIELIPLTFKYGFRYKVEFSNGEIEEYWSNNFI